MTSLVKQCAKCGFKKPVSEFNKSAADRSGYQGYCRSCSSLAKKKWREENPSHNLLQNYGITVEDKDAMIAAQNNCCGLCGEAFKSTRDSHVDHCHNTGKLRDILCHKCNTGLGMFDDDEEKLNKAIDYIKYHATKITATFVPKRTDSKGQDDPQLGLVFAAGTGQDSYDLDHYQRTIQGEDADYRTQTRGGDGVGHGGDKVGTPTPVTHVQDYGDADTEVIRFEFGSGRLFD